MRIGIVFIACIFVLCEVRSLGADKFATAKEMVQDFYEKYLPIPDKANYLKRHSPRFSNGFKRVLDQNKNYCRNHARHDVCGFGADGDRFLDAQEIAPDLTFENSGATLEEEGSGKVRLKLNVFPSQKAHQSRYQRELLFTVVKEGGKWAIDDISYNGKSERESLKEEMVPHRRKKRKD